MHAEQAGGCAGSYCTSTAHFPRESDRTIRVGVAPQSVGIISDGQFGFIVLVGGNVVMLDIPGREIIKTIFVGGSPRFIIIGLYLPVFDTAQQQLTIGSTVNNFIVYALVVALLVIAIVFVVRHAISTKKQ